MMRRSSTANTRSKLYRSDFSADRHCNEPIHFSMPADMYAVLQDIPGIHPILPSHKHVAAEDLCDLFKRLMAISVVNMSSGQQLAIEQCKLAIMNAVHETILHTGNLVQELKIAEKMEEHELRKQVEEANENLWWKKLISHIGFWIYFIYNVTCEFLGYVAMMSEILGFGTTVVFNPATLIFAIPMVLIGAMLYIAFEGSFFGLELAVAEKHRLKIMGEQIDANDKINTLLNDEDSKKVISTDAYRSFAFLAIQFNAFIQDRKDHFQPKEDTVQKRKYWLSCALGVIVTLGAGYYAGVTVAAAIASSFVVVMPPVAIFVIIAFITVSLLIGFYKMQAGALKNIFMPTLEHEQALRDDLDQARVKDKKSYLHKIQDTIINDRAPLLEQQKTSRIFEHKYADEPCHRLRPRSNSMNFVSGIFGRFNNPVVEQAVLEQKDCGQGDCSIEKKAGY